MLIKSWEKVVKQELEFESDGRAGDDRFPWNRLRLRICKVDGGKRGVKRCTPGSMKEVLMG